MTVTRSTEETGAASTRTIRRVPTSAERHPVAHRRRRRAIETGLAFGVPALLIGLWQVASSLEWIDSRLYPSPTDTIAKTVDLWQEGRLWDDLSISIRRMLLGWSIGSAGGVVLGLAMGVSRLMRSGLEPLLSALYTVPKLSLIPVFLAIFGFGESPIVALIAVTVFFFVWISTLAAIVAVPEGYREAGHSMGLTQPQMFRHVLLPASLPQIFVGLRLAAGVSLLMLIGVEFVIGGEGIGNLIEQGRTLFLLDQTYAGIAVSAILGLAFMLVVRWVGRRITPWSRDDEGVAAI